MDPAQLNQILAALAAAKQAAPAQPVAQQVPTQQIDPATAAAALLSALTQGSLAQPQAAASNAYNPAASNLLSVLTGALAQQQALQQIPQAQPSYSKRSDEDDSHSAKRYQVDDEQRFPPSKVHPDDICHSHYANTVRFCTYVVFPQTYAQTKFNR